MRQPATSYRTIAPNTDTRENVITWFTREFGFSRNAATALHDVQALKDAQALSELDDDDAVANVCKAIGKDIGQTIAMIAATKLKLACFWVRRGPVGCRSYGARVPLADPRHLHHQEGF